MNDQQLLQQFLKDGSQPAFAALVQRHVNVVYASALRQVRDPHLAEDVTQAVFIVLHQKAAKLGAMPTLGGWLLKVTRYASVDAMRQQARQHRHERAAARPEAADRNIGAEDFSRVAPVLDEALAKLSHRDRNAIVMRYLEDATFPEVGQKLGISEEAARKRVGRAMLKLRGLLARKGVAVSLGGLSAMIVGQAAVAAPPHVAASAASIVAGAGAATAASASIASGTLGMMSIAKAKLATAVAASLLLIGAGGTAVVMHVAGPKDTSTASAPIEPATAAQLAQAQALLGPWHTYIDAAAEDQPPRMRVFFEIDRVTVAEDFGASSEMTSVFAYGVDPQRQPPYIAVVGDSDAWEGRYELKEDLLRLTLWEDAAASASPADEARVVRQSQFSIVLHRGEPSGPDYVCTAPAEQNDDAGDEIVKQNQAASD